MDSGDENPLQHLQQGKNSLRRQGQGIAKRTKGDGLLINPSPGLLCFQTVSNICVGPRGTLLLSVDLNGLERNL